MGWGITIKEVYVSRATKEGLDAQIEEQEDLQRMYEDELLIMCAESPRDVKNDDGNVVTWEEHISFKFRETIQNYKECVRRLNLLYIAKESETEDD